MGTVSVFYVCVEIFHRINVNIELIGYPDKKNGQYIHL